MTAALEERNCKAAEYLRLLRSLAAELETAMQAIARNALPDLEESVSNQQTMSSRLTSLANEISVPLNESTSAQPAPIDSDLMRQILSANNSLQSLNRGYAALLQHSSHSVALMVSFFASVKGQFQEAPGSRLKYQTWSCRM